MFTDEPIRTRSLFSSRWLLRLLLFPIASALLSNQPLEARFRFDEGDWIAWGDTRTLYDFDIGRNTVYIATVSGLLRWDRNDESWLYPWYSVPGPLDEAIILNSCFTVREDPLTLDLYVRTAGGWYLRHQASQRWSKVSPPEGGLARRLRLDRRNHAQPGLGVLTPHLYLLDHENKLLFRYLAWPFVGGIYDNRDHYFFAWNGFGVGIQGKYSQVLELFPGGPGSATALAVTSEEIWCASTLDRDSGWLWRRKRSEDGWKFFHPDLEWGLEPAEVNRIRVGDNGTVWLATTEGLAFSSGNSWRWLRKKDGLPRREIHDIAPFVRGAWLATEFGLAMVDESSGLIQRPEEDINPVPFRGRFNKLAADRDTLWAAGPGLLMRYDKDKLWREIAGPPTIAVATYPTALYAHNGVLAVGDEQGFAWCFQDGSWHQAFSFNWRDGIVLSIAFHRNYFWLGTDRGLVKYDPALGDAVVYTAKDGLVGSAVFEIFPEGDWLWLGTDAALVRFRWFAEGRID